MIISGEQGHRVWKFCKSNPGTGLFYRWIEWQYLVRDAHFWGAHGEKAGISIMSATRSKHVCEIYLFYSALGKSSFKD